jgi:O-antigen ligase
MSRKMIVLGLIFSLLPMVAMLITALGLVDTLAQRAGNLSTIYGRIATWMIGWDEALKSPIFGIGLNNLRDVLNESDLYFQGIRRYRSAHNSYLALLAEQGFVGLLTYLAVVLCIIQKGLRLYRMGTQLRERWWGVVVVTVMTAYLFPSLFGAKLHTPNAMLGVFVFALVGGIVGVYGRPRVMVYRKQISLPTVKRINHADVRNE